MTEMVEIFDEYDDGDFFNGNAFFVYAKVNNLEYVNWINKLESQ